MIDKPLLHEIFTQQAQLTPHSIALTFDNKSLTYAVLDQKSKRLALHLQSLGVQPETLVALCVERGFDLVIAILAILKAGGAYLPLDVDSPTERLAFILDDAKAEVVITQSCYQQKFTNKSLFLIDDDWDQIISDYSPPLLQTLTDNPAQRLIYVIYTSGSTGQPKGVQVTHLNVKRLLTATAPWFNFNQTDVWALFHSYAFDMSVWELWGALLYGGRLVIVPHLLTRDPEQFYELLIREKITCLNQTPSAFAPLVRIDQEFDADLLSLRFISFGGEALNFKVLEPWLIRHGDNKPRMINMYGITETTVHSTYRPITLEDIKQGKGSLIGVPIPDLKIHLLNNSLQEVTTGEIGEIYVSGAGVTRGYLHRPELTAQRFIENPAISSERLYKSGDLAKKLANGDIEYIGRIDTQIKIRGFRIELGEIESVLAEHPAVNETVVIAHEHHQQKQLVAYLVAQNHASLTQQLQTLAQAKLPDYMIPVYFVFLPALPLTVNGKVDRQRLPEPDYNLHVVQDNYVAATTKIEQILTTIWQQLLNINKIGLNDNFFQLGGDSILVIQVTSLAKKQGLKIAPKQLFLYQTIVQLAQHVEQQKAIKTVTKTPTNNTLLLTPIQHWFFEQNFKHMHHWNQAVLLKLLQPLSADILQSALQALQLHHSNLRLRFTYDQHWQADDNPNFKPLKLTIIDLSYFAEDEKKDLLQESAEQAQSDLNLQKGVLMRVILFKLSKNEHRLLIIIHHLVVDGVSWRILLEDLTTACQQLQVEQSINLPETGHYPQWTQQLKTYADSIKSVNYWLKPTFPLETTLPKDFSGINNSSSTKTVSKQFDQQTTRTLLQSPDEKIQDLLLTALFLSLADFSQQRTVLIDLEGHGRELITELDLSRMCGWFTSLYPLPLDCQGNPYDVLQRLKQQLNQLPKNGLDYGVLCYLSNNTSLREKLQALPKAEVIFNYLGQFDHLFDQHSLFSFADEAQGNPYSAESLRPHYLEVEALIYQGCLKINLHYSENCHHRSSIETIADTLEHYLQQLLASIRLGDFSLSGLSFNDLTTLQQNYPQLEAVYPVSSTQEGMLFHILGDAEKDVYFEQQFYQLEGTLDEGLFKKVWSQFIQEQQILRTCMVWKGLKTPLQIVQKNVPLIWQRLDLTQPSGDQQWQEFIKQDRENIFALDHAPLMRFTLVYFPENKIRLVWTHSHLLLDGWAVANSLKTVLLNYDRLLTNKPVINEPVIQYKEYIAWLIKQDKQQAQSFWLNQLHDCHHQLLTTEQQDQHGYIDQIITLPESVYQALQDQAKQQGLTLNSFIQVAWGFVLAEKTHTHDVLFGITVSGRSVPVSQIDQMVGLFINTLPLRLQIDGDLTTLDFLKQVQLLQVERQQYEHIGLSDIQHWLNPPLVFDSLVIFENYPVDPLLSSDTLALRMTDVQVFEHTNYPLTLLAIPKQQMSLQITYNSQLFSAENIQEILKMLVKQLTTMSENLNQVVNEWLVSSDKQQDNADFLLASMALSEDF